MSNPNFQPIELVRIQLYVGEGEKYKTKAATLKWINDVEGVGIFIKIAKQDKHY